MRTFLTAFLILTSSAAFANPTLNCQKAQDPLADEFCQVSYFTLAQVQELQILEQAPSTLNIEKMEKALNNNSIKREEVNFAQWPQMKSIEKANQSFKILLEKSNQKESYFQELKKQQGLKSLQFDQAPTSTSTGTRGGGLGNETYILPAGFWID